MNGEPLYDLDKKAWDKYCPCVLAEQLDPECPWHGRVGRDAEDSRMSEYVSMIAGFEAEREPEPKPERTPKTKRKAVKLDRFGSLILKLHEGGASWFASERLAREWLEKMG